MATGACLAMRFHVSFSRHICSFLVCESLRTFLQIQRLALPFLIGGHGRHRVMYVSHLKFLQCVGAGWYPLAGLVPAHRVAMEPLCYALYFRGLKSKENISE